MSVQQWADIRHHLHQHPETGFNERQTATLIAEFLMQLYRD